MGFSEHQDNLSIKNLENQDKKRAIEQVLQKTKQETSNEYGETLQSLRPDQIGMLIKKNYFNEANQQFLPYGQIHKDYAYSFLVQTALTMLGAEIDIDADYGPKTKASVQAFQREHGLTPDGQVGPDVLNLFVSQLRRELAAPEQIQTIKQKEIHSLTPKGPLSYEAYKEASNKQREKACFTSLVQLGFSPIVAAGIAGNIYVESYDRKNTKKHFHTNSYGDGGKSFGLCQWNNNGTNKKSGRLATLQQFAKSQGTLPDAYDTQLAFIKYELESTEQKAGKQLAEISNVDQAAKIFMMHYERPSNSSTLKERQKKAREILQEYGGVA